MAPPVFIVGCPRSGTTLLRFMVNAHPNILITPETHFIVHLAPRSRGDADLGRTLERVIAHPRFLAFGLTPDEARHVLATSRPGSYAAMVASLFAEAAARAGKERWGDKTPGYVQYIPRLDRLFPGAQFIHIIRDGREVAASLAEQPWGSRTAISGAFWWRRKVRAGQRAGRRLGAGHYLEVRLDELIADPENQLRTVCAFLGEDFDPAMLHYQAQTHHLARQGILDTPGRRHLAKPPTAGLRQWDRGLDAGTRSALQAVCHRLLTELGYEAPQQPPSALLRAYAQRGVDFLAMAPALVRARSHRARRTV